MKPYRNHPTSWALRDATGENVSGPQVKWSITKDGKPLDRAGPARSPDPKVVEAVRYYDAVKYVRVSAPPEKADAGCAVLGARMTWS